MNFTKQINLTFSRDAILFLRGLRDQHLAHKFEFLAVKNSPADVMYRKFNKKHGGRVTGQYTDTMLLSDGKYYNGVSFEIMRKDMNF